MKVKYGPNKEFSEEVSLEELEAAERIYEREVNRMSEVKLVPLPKDKIDAIFEKGTHQVDVCIALYKLVMGFDDWSEVGSIQGWPTINKFTSKYLFDKFIDFDSKHHPEVLKGGVWLDKGFSSLCSDHVPDWQADISSLEIIPREGRWCDEQIR